MVAISSGEARSSAGSCAGNAHGLCHPGIYLCWRNGRAGRRDALATRRSFRKPVRYRFAVAGIPAAGFIMNLVVLTAALSAANASLYVTSRMLFSLARSGYAPRGLGALNRHGVPMGALMTSMLGIVAAIVVQYFVPQKALSLHHQCCPGRRHDRMAGFSAGACALPAGRFPGHNWRKLTSFAAGRGWLDTGICRRGGCRLPERRGYRSPALPPRAQGFIWWC